MQKLDELIKIENEKLEASKKATEAAKKEAELPNAKESEETSPSKDEK